MASLSVGLHLCDFVSGLLLVALSSTFLGLPRLPFGTSTEFKEADSSAEHSSTFTEQRSAGFLSFDCFLGLSVGLSELFPHSGWVEVKQLRSAICVSEDCDTLQDLFLGGLEE